jgi:4-amino-4-deoxy-L-arabinose transferase-like glycosyltransferase/sugar lactone lactonase YvrE
LDEQDSFMTRKISPVSFFFGLAALIFSGVGQFQLETHHIQLAIIYFILAIGIFVFIFRKQPGPQTNLSSLQPVLKGKRLHKVYITGGAAVLFSALAFWMFTTSIPSIYPWLLHFVSLALLVLSVVWAHSANSKEEEDNVLSWSRLEILLLLAIFGIGLFMRLYRFNQIPFGTWFDEADNGLNALKILTEPGYLPVYVASTNLPAHFLYLIALSFQILGVSTLAIRAVSVVFGLATIAAGFFVGQELFDRRTGLVLAFLLAVSRWDVNWSRIGMHGITVPFFELLTIGLTLRALRRQHLLDYTLAGLSLGFGLCFYTPFRLFPVLIGLFFLAVWRVRKNFISLSWPGFAVFGLAVIIATVPISQLLITQPDTFLSRMQQTSIFTGKTMQEGIRAVAQTTREHLLMFNFQGDRNGRHNLSGEPMLDPISASLLVLGTALSLWRIRQPSSFLLVAWLVLMLAPGIFSLDFESPQSLRAIGSLPAAYLLAVVPIHALRQKWDKLTPSTQDSEPKQTLRRAIIFSLPLILVLGALGYFNYHTYFDLQAISFESWDVFSTPETIVGNVMRGLGNQVNYYVSTFYFQVPTLNFLAPQVTAYNRLETHETLPLPFDSKKGVVMFVDADRKPFFQQAQQYYPHASFQEFKSPQGQTILYEIYLKTTDIAASQGLVASYYQNSNWSGSPGMVRNDTNFNFDWQDGDPAAFPFSVEWKGILFAPVYGTYHLVARSPSDVNILIDDVQVALTGAGVQTAQIKLAKGNHTIRIRTVAQSGHFTLLWQPPNGELGPIPLSSLLLPPITNNGLVGSYFANGNWQNPPAYVEIDPWIHYYFHNPPLPRPYTVEWIGKIKIANAGQYHFGLESIDESSLYIDNQQVVNDVSPNQYVEQAVDLPAGFHLFRLRFADRTGSTHINIYWSPPGSERTIIPSDVLFPLLAGEKVINTVTLVKETPAQPGSATSNLLNPTDLPTIRAQLMWETGSCGSGQGQFQSPHGITVDQKGNIWVADSGNKRIVGITSQGKVFKVFGQAGDGQGQFLQPYDLVVEQDGSLMVLDSAKQNFLQRFTQTGTFLASFGSTLGTYSPRGLGIDNTGNLYVADTGGTRLIKVSPTGDLLVQWKNEVGKLGFSQLSSVDIALDGSIYIVDPNGLIWKLLPDGKFVNWPAIAPIDPATGPHVGISSNNIIYVTDPEKHMVVSFNPDGKLIGQLSSLDGNQALFSKPVGLAIGSDDTLFVSDNTACRILAFKLARP